MTTPAMARLRAPRSFAGKAANDAELADLASDLAVLTGWTFLLPLAGALVGLLAASYLLGLGYDRALELRADRFAARLAGTEAVRELLGFFRSRSSAGGGGILSDHPTLDEREARLPRWELGPRTP
ncbi:MAG: hypothetical protein HY748_04565 [Elusimicrobia bacterium]|nr:hypothetical protein [Elusimicrobiota bacterium]